MDYSCIDDAAINMAYELVRLTIQPPSRAEMVVVRALAGLESRLNEHRKNRIFRPQTNQTRIRMSTLQVFQQLVLEKSEEFEREDERMLTPNPDSMLVRYVKSLLTSSSRRNAFYVATGITRLLYSYKASEAMAIYDCATQGRDRDFKEPDSFRRAKGILFHELCQRFRCLVIKDSVPGSEVRFESATATSVQAKLVETSLDALVPWDTSHVRLNSNCRSEMDSIHALIHPHCFAELVGASRMPSPEQRLVLPTFLIG